MAPINIGTVEASRTREQEDALMAKFDHYTGMSEEQAATEISSLQVRDVGSFMWEMEQAADIHRARAKAATEFVARVRQLVGAAADDGLPIDQQAHAAAEVRLTELRTMPAGIR